MTRDPDKLHRRSIRMLGYDYTQPGAHFATICTQSWECLLGDIVGGEMGLNGAGSMVQSVWDALPDRCPGVGVDAFVIVPNHIHGIVVLTSPHVGARPRACPDAQPPVDNWQPPIDHGQPRGVAPTGKRMSLPDVVHRFKSLTTARYRHGVYERGWSPFPGTLCQRNYYEHIIRNERALHRIRAYIVNNPARWAMDIDNPDTWQAAKTIDLDGHYAALWGEP